MPTIDPLLEDKDWICRNMELGDRFRVICPLDDHAIGNWATVWDARFCNRSDPDSPERWDAVALKIMRRAHLTTENVYGMFSMEASLLRDWHGRGSAAQLLACGYLHDTEPHATHLPPNNVVLCSGLADFSEQLASRRTRGWRPFLVLSHVPYERTLLYRLHQLHHPNTLIPLTEALEITIQGLELLQTLHEAHLIYRDHKPEHVTWHRGHLQFLDWNGALVLQNPQRGSDPHSDYQGDIQNFIAYAVFPLFAGRTYDNKPVSSIRRGMAHPPQVQLAVGEQMAFYEATERIPEPLREILSRPFYPPAARYAGASDMAKDLREYRSIWSVPKLAEGLDSVLDEVAQAQQHLRTAQQKMRRLVKRAELGPNRRHAINIEIRRVHEGLQRMIDQHLLPLEEEPSDTSGQKEA